ncbi:MAG: sodium-dependent bicarbonate transport family permease [Xanthomonadales bacterium]
MTGAFLSNLSSPPLLFFFLGLLAVLVRSDLDIPGQIARFLSLYLLFAIGFKGGAALAVSDLGGDVWISLGLAMVMSALVPLYSFFILRRRFSVPDAAAIAATYGSVSAVTFITAASFLDAQGVEWSGYLVAGMALMESPAIIVGMLLYNRFRQNGNANNRDVRWGTLLHEACFNGSVFLILGSMAIGWITGPEGKQQVAAVIEAPFLGVLCLFLLDMGIVAGRRLRDLYAQGSKATRLPLPMMVVAALVLPLVNGGVALVVGAGLGLPAGDLMLLTVLAASASYIAVPAAMRLALPEANPSTYLAMSLAITFPFNILFGIPLYHQLATWLA